MEMVLLDEVDQAYESFRHKLEQYKEYVKYLETLPVKRLSFREKAILKRHGSRKDGREHIILNYGEETYGREKTKRVPD